MVKELFLRQRYFIKIIYLICVWLGVGLVAITENLKDENQKSGRLGSLGLLWGSKIPGSQNLSIFLLYHGRLPQPRSINGPRWLQELLPFNTYFRQQKEERSAVFCQEDFPEVTHTLCIGLYGSHWQDSVMGLRQEMEFYSQPAKYPAIIGGFF